VAAFFEENDEEQMIIYNLVSKMDEYLDDANVEPYCNKYMKRKLIEYFRDQVVFATIDGKADVISFREKASEILNDFYYLDKGNDEES
jgi:hypothetical protein